MRVDRSHLPWIGLVVVATAVAWVFYAANFHPQWLPFHVALPAFFGEVPPRRQTFGGTPLGLIFGIAAYAIFFFASSLGIRKKRRTLPIGSVRTWLRAHIWLSVFTLPLVLFHAGFHLGGAHTTWLMMIYGVVMVSGVYGLVLQQFMPRLMKERLTREIVFEQIPHFLMRTRDAAATFRSSLRQLQKDHAQDRHAAPAGSVADTPASIFHDPSVDIIAGVFDEHCEPYLAASRGERLHLGDARVAADTFRTLKLNVTRSWHPQIDQLEVWCDERRMMDLQTRYQHWLHAWLFVHVPLSFTLLVFTGWHAWVELRFLNTLR